MHTTTRRFVIASESTGLALGDGTVGPLSTGDRLMTWDEAEVTLCRLSDDRLLIPGERIMTVEKLEQIRAGLLAALRQSGLDKSLSHPQAPSS